MEDRRESSALSTSSGRQVVAERVAGVALFGLLCVAPLALGGRHDAFRMLSAAFAAIGGVAACCLPRHKVTPRWIVAVSGVLLGILCLQAAPLPAPAIEWLRPKQAELLLAWGDSTALGAWRSLSLNPTATLAGLAMVVIHLLAAACVFAYANGQMAIRRLVHWIAYAAAGMSVLGFAQHLFGNGRLLWVYEHPHRSIGDAVQGAFANSNHFAHFLVLGLGPAAYVVWEVIHSREQQRKTPRLIAAATLLLLTITGVLASGSRGGLLALAVASATCVAIIARGRRLAVAVSLVGIGTLAVALVGSDELTDDIGDLTGADVERLDAGGGRRVIWTANALAFRASPILGNGAAGHRDYYHAFTTTPHPWEFTHAESGYMQVASELGVAGLLVVTVVIVGVGATCWSGVIDANDAATRALWAALVPGLVASTVHSAVDFVWYVPALSLTTVVLACCAIRLQRVQPSAQRRETRVADPEINVTPRLGLATVGAAFAVATLLPSARAAFAWDRYHRQTQAVAEAATAVGTDPAGDELDLIARASEGSLRAAREAAQSNPNGARHHLAIAQQALQLSEVRTLQIGDGLSVDAVRDAALASRFPSASACREWVKRPLGERAALLIEAAHHAQVAVRLSPTLGRGYLLLGRVDFLTDDWPDHRRVLSEQAVRTRGDDGDVLFDAGVLSAQDGRTEAAVEYWRRCAQMPGSHLTRLAAFLVMSASAEAFLADLAPGHEAIAAALPIYQKLGAPEEVGLLCDRIRDRLTDESAGLRTRTASNHWRQLSEVYRSIDRSADAAAAAQRAVTLLPYDFWCRLELVRSLRLEGRLEEAAEHLRWCVARRPDLDYLYAWIAEDEQIKSRARTARMRGREVIARGQATSAAGTR